MSLLFYYLKLSLRSLKQTPLVSFLTIFIIGLGSSLVSVNLALLETMYSDPIPEKSENLFHISLNTWQDLTPHQEPFYILRYKDAMKILESDIPKYATIFYRSHVYVQAPKSQSDAMHSADVRAFSGDFFNLTQAPFQWGSGWELDDNQQALSHHEIVISHRLNQLLFDGENSLGKTLTIQNKSYSIVGVLKKWNIKPRFYHVTEGQTYFSTEDIFIPLETAIDNNWIVYARMSASDHWTNMDDTRSRNVFYLQSWVQLNNPQQRQDFQLFLDNYSQSLKDSNEHPLAINNELNDVKTWMQINNVVDKNIEAFSVVTLLFLIVCLFNASSLLLAKHSKAQFETGLRRALGVSRRQLYAENMIESVMIGFFSGLIALCFSVIFLYLIENFLPNIANIIEYELFKLGIAFFITLSCSLLIAIYPVYSTYRQSIALQIK
ncbi:MAG: ABC transporter permease [Pseudomonadota bacterium]